MQIEQNGRATNIALFLDIENMIGGASSQGLPIDALPIVQSLKKQGRILIRRSYGDITNCIARIGNPRQELEIRRMLTRNLFQVEDIPYMTTTKNTADIRLVVDALAEAYTNKAITHFAVVSTDRDYIPLYNKLHELDKTVIAIVVDRMNVNNMVIEAADKVEYYETFFATSQSAPSQKAVEEDTFSAGEVEGLKTEYFQLLQNAVQALEKQERLPVGARVYPMMLQLRSDFEPANIGLTSFKNFVKLGEEKHLVKVDWGDGKGDYTIHALEPQKPSDHSSALSPNSSQIDIKKVAKAYKKFLEDKLKLIPNSFPTHAKRVEILHQADQSRQALSQRGPFTLDDWKEHIIQTGNMHNSEERLVYKILLSLRYARCLYLNQQTMEIVGCSIPLEKWDDEIVRNFCRQIRTEGNWGTVIPEAAAEVFFASEEGSLDKVQEILSDL